MITSNTNRRVAWLTSLPAPYRFPVWNELAFSSNLQIYFTNGRNNKRGWDIPEVCDWKSKFIDKKIFYFGEAQIIPNPFGFFGICRKSDVVIIGGGWEVPIHFMTAIWARLTRKHLLIIAESTLESHRFRGKIFKFLRRCFFNLANIILTVGHSSTESVKACGIDDNKIKQLFNPVDSEYFLRNSKQLRKLYSKGHKFLCVGRLIPIKNFHATILAFKRIHSADDSLTIVGDGPEKSFLQKLIEDLNLTNHVFLVGEKNQSELIEYYANAHTVVMASTNEVWGMVASEALSSGCHVVVSNVAGITSSIDRMRGVFVCSTDIESISVHMSISSKNYKGPITNPEILKYSPQVFAQGIIDAIEKVTKL